MHKQQMQQQMQAMQQAQAQQMQMQQMQPQAGGLDAQTAQAVIRRAQQDAARDSARGMISPSVTAAP